MKTSRTCSITNVSKFCEIAWNLWLILKPPLKWASANSVEIFWNLLRRNLLEPQLAAPKISKEIVRNLLWSDHQQIPLASCEISVLWNLHWNRHNLCWQHLKSLLESSGTSSAANVSKLQRINEKSLSNHLASPLESAENFFDSIWNLLLSQMLCQNHLKFAMRLSWSISIGKT